MKHEDGYGGVDVCPRCDAECIRAYHGAEFYLSPVPVPYIDALVLLRYREPAYLVWPRSGRGLFVSYWYGNKPERGRLYIAHRCGYWP